MLQLVTAWRDTRGGIAVRVRPGRIIDGGVSSMLRTSAAHARHRSCWLDLEAAPAAKRAGAGELATWAACAPV